MISRHSKALVGAALTLGLLTTACSSGSDPQASAAGATKAAAGPTEITFWSFVKGSDVVTDAFNRTHSDVHVTFQKQPPGQDYYSKLQNAVGAGSVPDVAVVEYYELPEFASRGAVEDLTGTLGPTVKDKFPPAAQQLVNLGGRTWGVPRDVGPLLYMYRKDFYDQHKIALPTTWDQYKTVLQQVKKADPKARGGVFYTNNPGLLEAYSWQAGDRWFGTTGDSWKVGIDGAKTGEVAAYWNDLLRQDLVRATTDADPFWSSVQKGETVSFICATWCAGSLRSTVPDQAGKWAVATVPSWDGQPASAMYGGSSFVIPKGAKNSKAAAEFISWITTDPEGMKGWVSTGQSSMFPAATGLVPVTKAAFPTDFYGGQDVYAVGQQSYDAVPQNWTWGPAMGTTNGSLADGLAKAASGATTLGDVVAASQQATVAEMSKRGLKLAQ